MSYFQIHTKLSCLYLYIYFPLTKNLIFCEKYMTVNVSRQYKFALVYFNFYFLHADLHGKPFLVNRILEVRVGLVSLEIL